MNDFNPDEEMAQMLGQMATGVALASAELHLAEAQKTENTELAGLWVQVRDSLSGRLVAEIQAQETEEAARIAHLCALADECDKDRAKDMAARMVASDGKANAKKAVQANIKACTVKDEAGNVVEHDAPLEQLWGLVLAAIG